LAAEVLESNFILSNFSNTDMRSLKADNPYKWFQLYWQGDREKSLALVQLAEQQNLKPSSLPLIHRIQAFGIVNDGCFSVT
jgi:isopentenyl diphosphate isomerase/L-lactate dehydrogenase-like FMN-dependent dehydrogenase